MRKIAFTFTVAASVFAASAHAAVDEARFQDAYRHVQAALAGDAAQVPAAVEKFSRLVQAEPGDPLLLANLGAVTAMQARATMLPWKKIGYAEDGMALQDKALALLAPAADARLQGGVPVTLLVKFTAANTFLAVPGFFGRGKQGGKLLLEVIGSPLFEQSPPGFRGDVWLRAASWARDGGKPDQAKSYLNAVIEHHAPQASQARQLLEQLK